MQAKYKIIILISFLFLLLSIGSSNFYYISTLDELKNQLTNQTLPLSQEYRLQTTLVLDNFTTNAKNIFYIGFSISLVLVSFIAFVLIYIIKKYNQQSEYFAHYDTLTEMPNRKNFAIRFEKIFALSKRIEKPLCLLFLDIDNFKAINDNFGHNVGDEVLTEISKIIKTNLRKTDIYARWGGDEFIIIFVGSSAEESLNISNKIRKAIEENLKLHHFVEHAVTISAGLTNISTTDTQDSAISRADKAMYIAKKNGKNRIELY